MKLIIDIPDVDYNYAKQQVADGITNPLKIFIASGIPLEQIRAEIVEEQSTWREDVDAEWHECRRILRIIDKYKGDKE